jgi:hypothetical protein
MGWMIGHAQVTEFAGFWPLEGDFLANSILRIPSNREAVILRADGAEDLRCGHASGEQDPVSRQA